MTLRAALAVVLAAALVAASLPAIESARVRASEEAARRAAHDVTTVAQALARESDPVPRDAGGARRTVELAVPERGPGTAELAYLAVGGRPGGLAPRDTDAGDVLAYRVRGGPERVVRVDVDLRMVENGTVRSDDAPLVLRGDSRLHLRLVRLDGEPVVLVSRATSAGADPVVSASPAPQNATDAAGLPRPSIGISRVSARSAA